MGEREPRNKIINLKKGPDFFLCYKQKALFQQIEDSGGILKYHNQSGAKEQVLKKILDDLGVFGKKGSQARIDAGRCVRYWYQLYCKDTYDTLYEKFDVKPNLNSARVHSHESGTVISDYGTPTRPLLPKFSPLFSSYN